MSAGTEKTPEPTIETIPSGLGSLGGCLVEGDPEQRQRERRVRRRALAISMVLETAALTVLVLVPLFAKTERIVVKDYVPIPPYSSSRGTTPHPSAPHNPGNVCHFCPPTNIPPTIAKHDSRSSGEPIDDQPFDGLIPGIPGGPPGLIPLSDPRRKVPPPDEGQRRVEQPRRLRFTNLDPAMLIHRVEPVYPPLAKQIHKEGRVELRAIIGTDGTIQSLEVISGDPLFLRSAREAVEQWRYKPTYLNGQPVEIDTFITVVYLMQH